MLERRTCKRDDGAGKQAVQESCLRRVREFEGIFCLFFFGVVLESEVHVLGRRTWDKAVSARVREGWISRSVGGSWSDDRVCTGAKARTHLAATRPKPAALPTTNKGGFFFFFLLSGFIWGVCVL